MDTANDRRLSFPQRNWFLLCVIVAILSPVTVHLLQTGAKKQSYRSALHKLSTDSARATDSSYKVASPPGKDSSPAKH